MSAKPSTGTLGQTPLCQLLIYLLDRGTSGSLVVQHTVGRKSSVTFEAGIPTKISLGNAHLRFGEMCVDMGMTTESRLEAFLEDGNTGPIGAAMSVRGLIPTESVEKVLDEQCYARLEWIASEPGETIFGFYPGEDYIPGDGRRIDVLRAIGRAAARRGLPDAQVAQVIQSFQGKPVRLHRAAQVARFGFGRKVMSALDLLRAKPMTIEELNQAGLANERELTQSLSVLASCRHIDVGLPPLAVATDVDSLAQPVEKRRRVATGAGPRPRLQSVSEGLAPEPPPESRVVPEASEASVDALGTELSDKLVACETNNYYQMLGVEEKADGAAIQTAWLQLAKKWHPDRLPPNARSLRSDVTKLFSRLAEAFQTLSNANQRAEYDRLRGETQASPKEQEDVQRVLRAASAFQKADSFAKRGDWAQAERLAKQAHELDDTQAEYGALVAWAIFKSGQRAAAANYEDLIATLSGAVKAQKNNVRIRLYRAGMYKAAGMPQEALRDYRAVVEIEPNNVDAARELRLHKMRADQSSAAPDGLLKRLFKK